MYFSNTHIKDPWTCTSGSWVWIKSWEHIYQIIFIDKCYLSEMTSHASGFNSCLLRTLYWSEEYGNSPSTSPPQNRIHTNIYSAAGAVWEPQGKIVHQNASFKTFPSKMIWIICSGQHDLFFSCRMETRWFHGLHLSSSVRRDVSYNDHSTLDCSVKSSDIVLFLLNH